MTLYLAAIVFPTSSCSLWVSGACVIGRRVAQVEVFAEDRLWPCGAHGLSTAHRADRICRLHGRGRLSVDRSVPGGGRRRVEEHAFGGRPRQRPAAIARPIPELESRASFGRREKHADPRAEPGLEARG